MDYLSKTDSIVGLFELKERKWIEVGRTEIVVDNLDPVFVQSIFGEYYFEDSQ